jgi:TMEM175 potassium channel family protein
MTSSTISQEDSAGQIGDKPGLERLIFFSDAVFAIAITLLVLEIHLPVIDGPVSNAELLQNLLAIWPKYLGYLVSFLVIGALWTGHHRKFLLIRRYNGRLLFLNLLLLMSIAFIPFPTSVISEYGNLTATVFYALSIGIAGLLSALVWWYAARNYRLVDIKLDRIKRWRELLNPLSVSLVFFVSAGLAHINSDLVKYVWLLLLPVTFFVR